MSRGSDRARRCCVRSRSARARDVCARRRRGGAAPPGGRSPLVAPAGLAAARQSATLRPPSADLPPSYTTSNRAYDPMMQV